MSYHADGLKKKGPRRRIQYLVLALALIFTRKQKESVKEIQRKRCYLSSDGNKGSHETVKSLII